MKDSRLIEAGYRPDWSATGRRDWGTPMVTAFLRRFALIISLTLTLALVATPTGSATNRGGIELDAIGRPTWKPVDCHLFSATIGTELSGYVEFLETLASLLPPPNHEEVAGLGIGPGAAHRPPYNSELAEGIAAQGLREGRRFSRREFSNGEGVFLTCMVVPRPGTRGSSPDFPSGRIIPNRLFPIVGQGDAYRNRELFDPFLDFEVPPLTSAIGFDVDGHSHFPVVLATNADFGPDVDLRGRYRYDLTMTDSSDKGWRLKADFVIGRR